MRRGHPGISGWRSEHPRPFRPRIGGQPRFRHPRSFPGLDTLRFPPPTGFRGPPPFNPCQSSIKTHENVDHRDRNNYRDGSRGSNSRSHIQNNHHGPRQHFSLGQRIRHNNAPDYNNSSNYFDGSQNQCHVNSMGDVDHRQPTNIHQMRQNPIKIWDNEPFGDNNKFPDNRHHNPYRPQDFSDGNKNPVVDYRGHRPPSSDHYGGNLETAIDNNNSFARSVDDTVDIVRKKLLHRNESSLTSDNQSIQSDEQTSSVSNKDKYQNSTQEQPVKRKPPKFRPTTNLNCDKIKDKIVHQLFKMDKDTIHKLMDNPSSSSKFEYAISSLITESQNSLNRHLRSVAEKSLSSSSSDLIHADNNSIYEDTFMKQMQCILGPQDTVLLEDIKPIVLAELSKALHLDDFIDATDQDIYSSRENMSNYDNYNNEHYNYEEMHQDNSYQDQETTCYDSESTNIYNHEDISHNYDQQLQYNDVKPLFERRSTTNTDIGLERRSSVENQQLSRRSIDRKSSEDKYKGRETPVGLFDTNAECLSEEDDPFADLDNQYHVAVDHNFIEMGNIGSPESSNQSKPPIVCQEQKNLGGVNVKIETENNKLSSIPQSPLTVFSPCKENKIRCDIELPTAIPLPSKMSTDSFGSIDTNVLYDVNIKQEHDAAPKVSESHPVPLSQGLDNKHKSSTSHATRKRSIDQRPSHRKEKRKKSESSKTESSKQTTNLISLINNTENSVKKDKFHEAAKTTYNVHPQAEQPRETNKHCKKIETSDKAYSDKYVKRKQTTPKKPKENELRKKHNSSTAIHSMVSPKTTSNTNTSQIFTNIDTKTKLKTIDMFVEQPKRNTLPHTHRNTAAVTILNKSAEECIPKQLHLNTVAKGKRHVATQVIKKMVSIEVQTLENLMQSSQPSSSKKKKQITKAVQTDPVRFEKSPSLISKSNDAFERMKEIDLEIQVLLQEKFKLYNSLESKGPTTLETLGMTVLNVTPIEELKHKEEEVDDELSEDGAVDNFTIIPVEELEQIVFETDKEDVPNTEFRTEKKSLRRRLLERERKTSESPTTRNRRKTKTPNISLIEQIITDDRPLEDIISLDDLENFPITKKKRKAPTTSKKQKKKSTKKVKNTMPVDLSVFGLKECSVVVVREDISKYLRSNFKEELNSLEEEYFPLISKEEIAVDSCDSLETPQDVVEMNDIQFDMLDVSEDIIIGDSCEVKSENKDISDHNDMLISEEIILDNSQSSMEDAATSERAHGDTECKTYDYSTDENLRRDSIVVVGNADAVLAIECVDKDFVAACLDGNVYHFSNDGQLLNTLRGSNLAVTCLTIVKEKYGTTVYTGSLDSRIRYYDLESGLEKGPECNVLSPIQTMERAWDTVFVGTRTGFVLQFECKDNMLIPVSTVKFSDQSILALRAMKEGARKVLLVAARSENVTIRDAQTGLLLRTLVGPKMTVYTVLFEDGKVYCGTSSHQIHVFDYASGSLVGSHEGGKGAVCLRATGGLVFAGCYDGCVYVYRDGEPRPLAQLRGPSLMLLSLAIVGTKIIAGYKDRSLYIWKIPLNILEEMIL